jgi:hypothetical protein
MKAKALIPCVLTAVALPLTSSWANAPAEPQWDGQQVSTMVVAEQAFDSSSSGSSGGGSSAGSADIAPPQ